MLLNGERRCRNRQGREKSSFGGLAATGRCPGASCPSPRTHLMFSLSLDFPVCHSFDIWLSWEFHTSLPPCQPQSLLSIPWRGAEVPCATQPEQCSPAILLPYFPSIFPGFEDPLLPDIYSVTLPSLHTLLGAFAAGGCAGTIDFLSLPPAQERPGPGPGISLKLKSFSEPSAPFPALPKLPALHFYISSPQLAAQGLMSPIINPSGLSLPGIQSH